MLDELAAAPLWMLFLHLILLSMMAVGGGVVVLAPDLHHFVVENHHWMTSEQFTASFALAQAAPGPNFLYVTLVGWKIAGWFGALAATLAVIVPPSLFTIVVMRLMHRKAPGRLGLAIREGLGPVSVGLFLATGWLLARTADTSWGGWLLTALTVVVVIYIRISPLWLIAAGAVAGLVGLV